MTRGWLIVGVLVVGCQDAAVPASSWADACHAASRRHMECGATLLEAGQSERLCREGGACVAALLRVDAIDPLMECAQASCDLDCAQSLEEALTPLPEELEAIAASQRRDECGLNYDLGRFSRLVSADVWRELLTCWDKTYCLDIQQCVTDVQHERFSACVEPLHLALLARPAADRARVDPVSGKRLPNPAGNSAAHRAASCKRMCGNIARSCRQSCRPQAWSPNMRARQDACERDCDFARFSCDSGC